MNRMTQTAAEQEQAIKRFLKDTLGKPKDIKTLQSILADMGDYYDGDRAYIFELNDQRTHMGNTQEWCREGVPGKIDVLRSISLEGLECWFEELEKNGEFFLSSVSERYDADSPLYRLMASQGIDSVWLAFS